MGDQGEATRGFSPSEEPVSSADTLSGIWRIRDTMWPCFTAGQRKPLCRVRFDTCTVIASDWHTFRTNFRDFAPDCVLAMALPAGNDQTGRLFVDVFRGIARRTVVITSRDVYRAFGRLRRLETGMPDPVPLTDRKSTRLNSSHVSISYAVFCLKKKKKRRTISKL